MLENTRHRKEFSRVLLKNHFADSVRKNELFTDLVLQFLCSICA